MSDFLYDFYLSILRLLKFAGVYAMLVFLLLASLIKWPLLDVGDIRQGFIVIGLYFWLIYRPSLWPYPLVFALGILLDILSGGLLGLNAFSFMVLALIIRGQRRFLLGQPWHMMWAGFFVAISLLKVFEGVVYAMTESKLPNPWFLGANIIISGLFYPFFHPLFLIYQKYLSDEHEQ